MSAFLKMASTANDHINIIINTDFLVCAYAAADDNSDNGDVAILAFSTGKLLYLHFNCDEEVTEFLNWLYSEIGEQS